MTSGEPAGGDGIQPPRRLWTPWRMGYVGGFRQPGCVFCNALASEDDVASLIVHRGEHAFVILNLYPYNTGHLMIVPNVHVSDPADLSAAARAEMAELSASFCTGLRLVTGCDGLNLGMNLRAAAGAGIADHLHQHLVPRWIGDANFMPIVGGTKVLPELLPATYGKLRAEVARQKAGSAVVRLVLLHPAGTGVFLDQGALPLVDVSSSEAAWMAAMQSLAPMAASCDLQGWAGPPSTIRDADQEPSIAVSFFANANCQDPYDFASVDEARATLASNDAAALDWAISRFG